MTLEHDILRRSRTVAVVGLSPKEDRASHRVAAYLQEQGYTIIPVNPAAETILGEKSYPNLEAIPKGTVDTVQLFRRAEDVPPIVEQAIKLGVGAVWMQEGIVNEDAASRARQAGLDVVMDHCMMKEHIAMTGG
jgi:predicted CoA-binding protein